jgi:E3 ubiquitin-protein ligase SIAH1
MAGKQPIITAEDLKEVLECPVCLRVPRSAPIFQCVRGHIVCNECHAKLETCPVCRVPLGSTRSLISEKVLSRYCDHRGSNHVVVSASQ